MPEQKIVQPVQKPKLDNIIVVGNKPLAKYKDSLFVLIKRFDEGVILSFGENIPKAIECLSTDPLRRYVQVSAVTISMVPRKDAKNKRELTSKIKVVFKKRE